MKYTNISTKGMYCIISAALSLSNKQWQKISHWFKSSCINRSVLGIRTVKFHLFAHLSHTLTTSKCILYAPGWATVCWSTAKISSLTDCFAIYNIRFSSNLPLSISEELFCHVFSLFSVESLSLKPFINHFPLLSWNALSYLKYARLLCVCARTFMHWEANCLPNALLGKY